MKKLLVLLIALLVVAMGFPGCEPTDDIDITPPTTTQKYGQPYYTDGVGEWITAHTEISLDATDDDSGVDYTKYRVWYNGEWNDRDTDWYTYTGPFTMGEIGTEKDCLHKIEYYSVDNAGNEESWQEVMVEADAAEFEAYSALAVDPFALRTTHLVYTEEASQDLIYEMSTDFGETWTGKTVLVSGLAEASEPDIEMAPNGDIHIVFIGYLPEQQQRISHIWYGFAANNYSYDKATDPANWEARVLVDDTGRDNVYPQIAIDSLNTVHCVWIGDSDGVESGGAQDIFYSRFDESGWSPRITLYASATNTPDWPNPQIIAGPYDDLHVVFLDSNEHMMKYLTYRTERETAIKGNGAGGNPLGEWGSYYGGSWTSGAADNMGGSSASYGTVAGMAIEGTILHITWQDVRNGDGEVYENTRDITTSNAFGPEWQITSDQYTDDDGTSVGETLMESGMSDNLHLFYRDSVGYDIWYMEYASAWSQPVKVTDSGAEHMHLWSEMTVDNFDSPLLTYTKATNDYTGFDIYSPLLTYTKSTNDYTECDICYRKPYHNQIVFVDNTPPTTTKKVSGGTITLEGRDNCHCEKHALLVAGPDAHNVCMAQSFINDVTEMETMLRTKCKETGGWNIEKLTGGNATSANLTKAFEEVKKVADEGRCCQFFFYYAGHGSGYHKDDGYDGGRINMNCTSESGESYNEKDFKISMTKAEWDALAAGYGHTYDTDGDGDIDMWFGKDGELWKGHMKNNTFIKEKKIGEDTDVDRDIDGNDNHGIDGPGGGADLNGDGVKNATFCVDEDLSLPGPDLYDDDFADLIKSVCNCTNTIIVLDCCHSGGFINDIKRENRTKPMVIGTACQEEEYSHSRLIYKDKVCEGGWGWYNHHLTAALRTCISVEKAHQKAIEGVNKEAKEGGEQQHPQIYDSNPAENKFLYCCGVGSYQIHYRIWYDSEGEPEQVGELNEPVSFKLTEPGEYRIEYWSVDDLGNEEEHHSQKHTIASMVAAGCSHTLGLKSDGTVVAVGENYDGQCEVGGWTDICQVAASGWHTVGLKEDGTVVAVGDNTDGQCEVGGWAGIVQVAAGWYHTVGLKSDGTVVATGYNDYGQCNVGGWTGITQVDAGGWHTVGLKEDGTVVAVGGNTAGQCNVNAWTGIIQIAAGGTNTVGLNSDGTVVAVGDNGYGQCKVGGWTGIIQIVAGGKHTVGLRADGTVVAVGDNTAGQCNVGGWTGIIQIAAGGKHTVGLRADGTVVAVGDNGYGQCNVGGWMLG